MKTRLLLFLLCCSIGVTAQVQMQKSVPLWKKNLNPAEIEDLIVTYKKQYDFYKKKSESDARSYEVYVANNGFNLSLLYYKKNELERSREYLSSSIAAFNRLKNMGVDIHEDLAKIYFQLGQMYDAEKKFDEALSNYDLAATSFHDAGTSSEYAFINASAAYSNMSNIHWNKNDYATALPLADKAIQELDAIKGNYENVAIEKVNKYLNAGTLVLNLTNGQYNRPLIDQGLQYILQLTDISERIPTNQQVQEWAKHGEDVRISLQNIIDSENQRLALIEAKKRTDSIAALNNIQPIIMPTQVDVVQEKNIEIEENIQPVVVPVKVVVEKKKEIDKEKVEVESEFNTLIPIEETEEEK